MFFCSYLSSKLTFENTTIYFFNHLYIIDSFLFLANTQTLSKTTALSFLKNRHHRTKRDDDLNISEECMEDTCVYEEVREYINYKKLDLNVASYLNLLFFLL